MESVPLLANVSWPVVIALLIGVVFGGAAGAGLAIARSRRRVTRLVADAAERERRATRAERLAEVGAMTAGLAHEIKNPLSTIGLNVQLFAESLDDLPIDDDERVRLARRADALNREVERLRGILADFLEYAGELRLDPAPTDLAVLVDELGDFFLPQAEQQGVRLRVQPAAGPLLVRLDAGLVKQAALNLMLNAVEAMAASQTDRPRELILRTERADAGGGGGSSSVSNEGAGQSSGPVTAEGATARLHITDTGPGIDEATRQRIFEPYFTSKSGGSGLGLPTTRRIVEAHGGRLELFSEPGRGTDFCMVFPVEG